MNAKLIVNDIVVDLGHQALEEIVFFLNDEPAMQDIFNELSKSPSSEIRKNIADNSHLPVHTRRRLIEDTDLEVMRTIIFSDEARQHMTLRDIERYLATGDREILTILADDLTDFTQVHEICETDWLCEKLINQPDPAVRYRLAGNEDTPVFFLKKLASDDDIDVARRALKTLMEADGDFEPEDTDEQNP